MPSSPQKNARRRQDFYPTPFEVIKGLFGALPPGVVFDLVIDPGAGPDGRIGRAFLAAGRALQVELVDLQPPDLTIPADPRAHVSVGNAIALLQAQTPPAGPILVGMNPPFTQAMAFLQGAVALINRSPGPGIVAQLAPLSFLGSAKRAGWFMLNPPARLGVIFPRPSFTSDGRTDSSEYVWMLWYNSAAHQAGWSTGVTWLNCPKTSDWRGSGLPKIP